MTGIDDIVVGFAVSYLAGNIPTIAQLFESNNSLKKRIENCYDKALIRWSKNEHIRNNISDNYRTLDNLSKYIVKEDSFEREDIVCLMQLWTDELRKDDLCYKVILELKSDLTNKNLNNGFKAMGLELSIIKSEIIEAIERQKPSKPFYNASSGLRSCNSVVGNDYHIDRHETSEIYSWIVTPETEKNEPQDRICFLLGEAGCGKSVILRDVLIKLDNNPNYSVLGLKSDLLFDSSDVDIDKALNLGKPLLDIVREQASEKHIVIIIDQIDALSATLSANRKPIMIMNALINEISQVSNVRVVVSCRSYDFNYDASFEKYRNKTKIINVQKLNNSDIQNALKSTGLSEIYNKTLLDLLAIPINLFLYCRLRNRKMIDKNPTVQGLYDEIWKEIVVDRIVDDTKTSKDYLLSYLTEFTNKLVSKQVLSIKSNCMGTKYSNEQNYLISNNILSHDLNTDNVQFIHQSLLDYVYARLFFENKESLEKQFENVHQGLYVRARLKQVLEYQRQLDSDIYIKNVNTILFGINDGTPRYRFQLKHLVLSILASRNDLLECEEKLLLNKILPDTKLSKTYLSLIITECGFVLLRKYIGELGGFNSLGIDKQCEIVNVANNISNLSPKDVVEFLLEIDYSKLNIKVLNSLILLINYRLLITKENYHSIEDVVDKIDNDSALMPFSELYKKLIKYDFKKVENRISKHIESLENERDHQSFFDFDLSYDAKELIDELKEHDKEEWFNFALEIIKSLAEKSEIQLEDEILSSSAFYLYSRDNDHYHFNEVLLSDVLTEIEYKVKNKKISSQLLSNLSNSKYSVCHIIAIVGWIQNVEEYSESIYNYLHDNILKITHASELGYYQRRLFGMSFDVFSNEQQDELLKIISRLSPDWEKVVISKNNTNVPNTSIGYTKAQYYEQITNSLAEPRFSNILREYQELKRKYPIIVNDHAYSVKFMSGERALNNNAYENMSDDDIINSAKKYCTKFDNDWNSPTITGHAMALRTRTTQNPERYYNIYERMLDDASIDTYYVAEGLQGLMDGNCDRRKIDKLFKRIIDNLNPGINKNDPGLIINLTRKIDYYLKSNDIAPEFLIDFIIRVAKNAEEKVSICHSNIQFGDTAEQSIDINVGINQVRGAAVYYLVDSHYMTGYRERIFSTLEEISHTASVATRMAGLYKLASFIKYDEIRTLNLTLKLLHDYDVNLLRMPLHSLNPLVYLVNKHFTAFNDYFKSCIKINDEKTCVTNITLLFRAWLCGVEESEELLLSMADSSDKVKAKLIRDVTIYYDTKYHDKCVNLLRRYLSCDNEDIGMAFDGLFEILPKWAEKDALGFVDEYSLSDVCKYAYHDVYKYLNVVALTHPESCLRWIKLLYDEKLNCGPMFFNLDNIIEILLTSYNCITQFDKNNSVLEDAMDLLDALLEQNTGVVKITERLEKIVE